MTTTDALSGVVESSITQSTEIDKKAKTKTQVIGTDKEEYPQIEDAPPEEEFDGWKLAGNILAGLAVVGAVALTLATFGAAGAVIVGAAIGGGLAVGLTAVGDIARGEVSSKEEYIFAGFTGAVTGAISGRIAASALKAGEKLLAEAGSGFVLGGIEDATRQVVLEGKELREVDGSRTAINGIMNAGLAIAVPLVIKGISKGIQAVVNKINTPGVNTVVGEVAEDVIGKGVKETSEEVVEEVAEKGSKTLVNNSDDVIFGGEINTKFTYKNNPMDNPKVLQDAIENPDAVYGFSPNPESKRIGHFASNDYDWTNPVEVEKYKNVREKYHLENDNILNMVNKMKSEGMSEEAIGRAAVNLRNQNRINSYLNRGDIKGYEKVLKSNMDMYGNSLGITPDMVLEKYGSWKVAIEKTTSANPGMDACCGLYDKYYNLYGN